MSIQVRCPNADCGKLLSVRDEYGGKTGKCPNCGAVMHIPDVAPGDVNVSAVPHSPHPPADEAIPVHPARSRRRHEEEDDDRRPRRRRYDDDDEDAPYVGRRRAGGSPAAIIIILAIGIGMLVFLGLTPLFPMLIPSGGRIGPPGGYGGMTKLTEGIVLMIGTLVVAGVCLATLIIYLFAPAHVSNLVVTLANCLAAGWGLMVMIWQLGFIWDIFMVIRWKKDFRGEFDPGFLPGIGLWIGLGLSLVAVVLFAVLAGLRGKGLWLYPAEGLGLIAGVLLLTLNVRPWNPGPSRDDLGGVATPTERTALISAAKENSRYNKLLPGH